MEDDRPLGADMGKHTIGRIASSPTTKEVSTDKNMIKADPSCKNKLDKIGTPRDQLRRDEGQADRSPSAETDRSPSAETDSTCRPRTGAGRRGT